MFATALALTFSLCACISDAAQKEAVLKESLYTLRNAIDQYTQEKAKAPQTLDDLVTAGFLHSIPVDPITNSNQTWQIVPEYVLTSIDQTAPGITDIHSGSNQLSSDRRSRYSDW